LSVVALTVIYKLVGPVLFRNGLPRAGELYLSAQGPLIVASYSEPYLHNYYKNGGINHSSAPGGVAVALDALMRERGGVWIAHGAGNADRAVVDQDNSDEVPPDSPAYRLRRLWLTPYQEEHYYAGFANSALWPLCHQAHVRPQFKEE